MGKRKNIPESSPSESEIEWRDAILRRNADPVKLPPETQPLILTHEDEIKRCFYYINNCVYWINQYIDGNVDKANLLKTAQSIELMGKKLQNVLNKPAK